MNAAAAADPDVAASVLAEALLATLEQELASLGTSQPSKVNCTTRCDCGVAHMQTSVRCPTLPCSSSGGQLYKGSRSLQCGPLRQITLTVDSSVNFASMRPASSSCCAATMQAQESAMTYTMGLLTAAIMPLGAAVLPLAPRVRAAINSAFAVSNSRVRLGSRGMCMMAGF